MRRLALLLTAVAMTFLSAAPASAQYPPVSSTVSVSCTVAVDATATASGTVTCVVQGLLPGSTYTVTLTFPPLTSGTAASFSANSAAVAFVGAQSSLSGTASGTVAADGTGSVDVTAPAGSCTSCPFTSAMAGTAADGSIAVATSTTNAAATPPATTPATDPATTPATGVESGILALIALGLVAAGAGAVVMARRKSHVEA